MPLRTSVTRWPATSSPARPASSPRQPVQRTSHRCDARPSHRPRRGDLHVRRAAPRPPRPAQTRSAPAAPEGGGERTLGVRAPQSRTTTNARTPTTTAPPRPPAKRRHRPPSAARRRRDRLRRRRRAARLALLVAWPSRRRASCPRAAPSAARSTAGRPSSAGGPSVPRSPGTTRVRLPLSPAHGDTRQSRRSGRWHPQGIEVGGEAAAPVRVDQVGRQGLDRGALTGFGLLRDRPPRGPRCPWCAGRSCCRARPAGRTCGRPRAPSSG